MMSKSFSIMVAGLAFMSTTSVHATNNLSKAQLSDCKDKDYSSVTNVLGKESNDDDEVFEVCEKLPVFEGGQEGMMNYFATNLKYPKIAKEWGVTSRILVNFIINKDGSIATEDTKIMSEKGKIFKNANELSEVMVVAYATNKGKDGKEVPDEEKESVKQAYKEIAEEAMRVVNEMPNWTPGEQKGKKVRVRYIIPVTFRLQ